VQITARVLEVALHKLHTLHFPLEQFADGYGVAPIPAPSPDFLTGMGRTNDAILFGGFVHLYVQCTDEAANDLAKAMPSSASKDYGRPFAEVFKAVNMDFYQIDPLLFSPAKVTITNLETGNPIFTDEAAHAGGWHGVALQQAFAKRGIEAVFVELQDCVMDFSGQQPTIVIPHLETFPSVAFVRGIAAGSLQQVIARLNILHMLRKLGCYVYNEASAIERTVDKSMTSFLLMQHQVPTPATWVCESRHLAHQRIQEHFQMQENMQMRESMVIKPLFGSQGKGVRLLDADSALPLPGDLFVDGVYYLQTFIHSGQKNHDYRVFVINNQVVASMRRSGEGWLNNVAQGAQCDSVEDDDIQQLALKAAKAINIAYCGVDIMRDEAGQLWVLEVNSIPAWRGLQTVCEVNVADLLVDDLIHKLPSN